jgi:hypothetical protein
MCLIWWSVSKDLLNRMMISVRISLDMLSYKELYARIPKGLFILYCQQGSLAVLILIETSWQSHGRAVGHKEKCLKL